MSPVRPTAFTVDLPLHLIQAVRLLQALAESSYTVHLPPAHLSTFRYLARFFPLEITTAPENTPRLPGLALDHETPRTSIGTLSRPLIFPRSLCDHLRARWAKNRTLHVSFSGLPTPKRSARLQRWFDENRDALGAHEPPGPLTRGWARLGARLQGQRLLLPQSAGRPELRFVASRRGRRFPVKAFDPRYYATLCRSCFVLCPDGDFVWTYRFFESCLCGAIPVIQSSCVHYDGFQVQTLDTPIDELEESDAIRAHNFTLACERLTVTRDALDAELARLLA